MQVLKEPIEVHTEFIGLVPYAEALALMEQAIATISPHEGRIWGLEHPLVYTTGLKAEAAHILDPKIPLVAARRGGSVTLHNPGQLVAYFTLPLAAVNGGLERFVRVLEAVMAEILLGYGAAANFSPGASGVFTHHGKIGFVGLGLKRGFIYHGVALNVNNNLDDFRAIHSCGLKLPITNLKGELENTPPLEQVFADFTAALAERFAVLSPQEFRYQTLARYDLTDWQQGFKLGWIYFHERRFWQAHELWELYWRELPAGELRIFFHALIQTAMAFYKIFTVPNPDGAASLLGKALQKFAVTRAIELLDNQLAFVEFLEEVLQRLARKELAQIPVPPVMSWKSQKLKAISS